MTLGYKIEDLPGRRYGLAVLQTDETLEGDMRQLLPADARTHVSRVPNAPEVTPETLGAMEAEITAACALLPAGRYDCVAYGCTSGTAVIGPDRVAELVRQGCNTARVTDPLSALIEACRHQDIRRLGFVSPYVAAVTERLRAVIEDHGIAVPEMTSFDESDDARVVRIDGVSVEHAAREMAAREVDAVFLSCTNLRTLDVIDRLSDCEKPIWSSNLLLAAALEGKSPARPKDH